MLTCSIAKESVWDVTKANIPFIGVLLATLLLVTYVPVVDAGPGELLLPLSMADTILVERDGAIATVVLNRPEKLNALTRADVEAPGRGVRRSSRPTTRVRCIVIRGAGTKAFAPGNDISEFATERSNVEQAREYGEDMRRTIEAIAACRHPVVAQIHGICVGGGLEIAGLADIRICGESCALRRADQQAGPGDGLRRDRLADRARRARRTRSRSCSRAASSTRARPTRRAWSRAWCPTTRWTTKPTPPRSASPTARRSSARWHKKFARRLADPKPLIAEGIPRELRLLRHRGLPRGLRGVPRQAQAAVQGQVTARKAR